MGARAPVGQQAPRLKATHAGSPLRLLLLQPLQPRFDIAQFKRFCGLADQVCQPPHLPRCQITPACSLKQRGSACGRSPAGRTPTGASLHTVGRSRS